MNDMTVEDALDYLDNVCVCHGCECWEDHDWGGCYRTQSTGKMACDLRDEAVEVLRKVVFRAMGTKDINILDKTTVIVEPFTTDMNHVGYCKCGYLVNAEWKYCPLCGARLEWK